MFLFNLLVSSAVMHTSLGFSFVKNNQPGTRTQPGRIVTTSLYAFPKVTPLLNIIEERQKIMQKLDETQVEATKILAPLADEASTTIKPYEDEVIKDISKFADESIGNALKAFVAPVQPETENAVSTVSSQYLKVLFDYIDGALNQAKSLEPIVNQQLDKVDKIIVPGLSSSLGETFSTQVTTLQKVSNIFFAVGRTLILIFRQEVNFLKSIPLASLSGSDELQTWIQEPITVINLLAGAILLSSLGSYSPSSSPEDAVSSIDTTPSIDGRSLETEQPSLADTNQRLSASLASLGLELKSKEEEIRSIKASIIASTSAPPRPASLAGASTARTVNEITNKLEKKFKDETVSTLKALEEVRQRESSMREKEQSALLALKLFLVSEGYLEKGVANFLITSTIPTVLKECSSGKGVKSSSGYKNSFSMQSGDAAAMSALVEFLVDQGYATKKSIDGLNWSELPTVLAECKKKTKEPKKSEAEAYMNEIMAENEDLKQKLLGKDEKLWELQKAPSQSQPKEILVQKKFPLSAAGNVDIKEKRKVVLLLPQQLSLKENLTGDS